MYTTLADKATLLGAALAVFGTSAIYLDTKYTLIISALAILLAIHYMIPWTHRKLSTGDSIGSGKDFHYYALYLHKMIRYALVALIIASIFMGFSTKYYPNVLCYETSTYLSSNVERSTTRNAKIIKVPVAQRQAIREDEPYVAIITRPNIMITTPLQSVLSEFATEYSNIYTEYAFTSIIFVFFTGLLLLNAEIISAALHQQQK